MKIALAKINQTAGKVTDNLNKISDYIADAQKEKCDLIVFPEFAICGGYCGDLLLNKDFIEENIKAADKIIKESSIPVICGTVTKDGKKGLLNSISLLYKELSTVASAKYTLNDSAFNDIKYFKKYNIINTLKIANKNIMFVVMDSSETIKENITTVFKEIKVKPDTVFILGCSPYYYGKIEEFKELIKNLAAENKADFAYLNLLGGNDGFIFDGLAIYADKQGNFKLIEQSFEEKLIIIDTDGTNIENKQNDRNKEMYDVLVLGLKDYMKKNKFKKCTLGISGGIDSALVAAIAADAIGSENVLGVLMPSKYTSKESIDCALELCKNLNIQTKTVPVNDIYDVYIKTLTPSFEGKGKDLTEENLQARIRSNILMALSNKFGYFVLCTGNKSEDAVGYSTLYGDATGGYSPISDLYKKEVYELSKYRNTISKVIPEFIITRPPTAELRENQKDSDSLPEYDILDDILIKILDKQMTYSQIIESGVKEEVLNKVWKLLSVSEYKRRQSPTGTKVSKSAFLRDITLPMSNGYIWKKTQK